MPSSYTPILGEHISGYAHTDIPVIWLPIASALLLIATIITVYCCGSDVDFWPTISIASSNFPASRVFAIGTSLCFFLNFFFFRLLTYYLELMGCTRIVLMKVVPYISTLSFVVTGCVGIHDSEAVHSLFACLGFGSLLVFSLLNYFAHKKLGILKLQKVKMIIHLIVIVMFIPMVILSIIPIKKKTKAEKIIHLLTENSTVLLLMVVLILLIPELRKLKVRLNVHLPEECVNEFF